MNFLILFWASLTIPATPLYDIQRPELSPEQLMRWETLQNQIQQENWDILDEWDRFRTVYGKLWSGNQTVETIFRQTLAQLPAEGKERWQKRMETFVQFRFQRNGLPETAADFRQLLSDFPGSLHETQWRQQLHPLEAAEKEESQPPEGYRCTMTQIFDPTGKVIFEDFLPRDLWGELLPSRTWKEEENQPEIEPWLLFSRDGKQLFARMGTRVSVWPLSQRSTRPQGYLAALDLTAEGRLQWIYVPESPQWAIVGKVVEKEGYLWVPMMEMTTPKRFYLACLDRRDGILLHREFLFTAKTTPSGNDPPLETIFLPQELLGLTP